MIVYCIGVLGGDGIGLEIVDVVVKVVKNVFCKVGVKMEWIYLLMGWEGIK